MQRTLLLLGFVAGFVHCQTRQSTTDATDTVTTNALAEPTTQCYAYVSATDTVQLTLTGTGETVRGELMYQLSGKDRNKGTLTGQMRGDTLLAEYTFQSEGVESVRQVAFLTQEGGFVEGYGPVREQNGRMTFTTPNALIFDTRRVLTKTGCSD